MCVKLLMAESEKWEHHHPEKWRMDIKSVTEVKNTIKEICFCYKLRKKCLSPEIATASSVLAHDLRHINVE
jgi:hypothetical protein